MKMWWSKKWSKVFRNTWRVRGNRQIIRQKTSYKIIYKYKQVCPQERTTKDLKWKNCLEYPGDILVMGRKFYKHLSNLREVFATLTNVYLQLHAKKCTLFQKKVNFLGHVVSAECIATNGKIGQNERKKREIRPFLGLCSFYKSLENEKVLT